VIIIQQYNHDFYRLHQSGSDRSAREIIPLILEFVQPRSVIDVGCGIGTWLSVFAENGVQDILGIDGEWVDKKLLRIPQSFFVASDLKQQIRVNREFDLVISLEVAEHLPALVAETFVDSLVELGPVIVFSAAIPLQGGVHHVNERWPNYWEKLFRERGYVVVDALRKRVWQKGDVEWWYAQNILIFVDAASLKNYPLLKKEQECTNLRQLSLVHPKLYLARCDPMAFSFMQLMKTLPVSFRRAVVTKLKRSAFRVSGWKRRQC
jgi:SAM-dependent methyltransferase